jgi:glycosyltransferase involved in cell wall biosynthesis
MHILLTADTVGGVWTYAQELATGLVRRGIDVTLVSFGEIPGPSQMRWTEGLRALDFRPTPFRLEWMQDSAADIAASSEYLLSIIRETRPDVLHFSQYCYGALDVDIPKIVIAHSDVVSWWNAVYGQDPPQSDWTGWYRRSVRRGLAGADRVIAPSRWMLQEIQTHYGELRSCSVTYNGRSPQFFNPHATKEDRVVTIGRLWDEGKQVSLLTANQEQCAITIAGAAEPPDSRTWNDGELCSGSVELKPKLNFNQVQALLAGASIYAATSRYEPFGLAPLEAALSRCAIIANDIPAFREIWGSTALYFDTNDANALRRAIAKLRADPTLRRHYAELAYQRARRLFSADRMVDEYLAVYHSLVAERSIAA